MKAKKKEETMAQNSNSLKRPTISLGESEVRPDHVISDAESEEGFDMLNMETQMMDETSQDPLDTTTAVAMNQEEEEDCSVELREMPGLASTQNAWEDLCNRIEQDVEQQPQPKSILKKKVQVTEPKKKVTPTKIAAPAKKATKRAMKTSSFQPLSPEVIVQEPPKKNAR